MNELHQLKNHKRNQIEKHQEFIKGLFFFMRTQELKPVHPIYSQNQFMRKYTQGYLTIRLFEKSVPRDLKFQKNQRFSIRVDRKHDNYEYPLCWIELDYLQYALEENVVQVDIKTAMQNKGMVFVGGDWVSHMQTKIDKNKKESDNKKETYHQKEINHYKKLLRL